MASARASAASPRLYEIAGDFVRLDPETLDPVRGQRAPLGSDSWAWSFAPGRDQSALPRRLSPGARVGLIERVRRLRLALPEAFELETWGHPTFGGGFRQQYG